MSADEMRPSSGRPRRRRRRRPRGKPKTSTPKPTENVEGLLDRALANSTADETELVWIDATRSMASSRGRTADSSTRRETTLFVRVLEGGRLGAFRTGNVGGAEIDLGIRQAVAQSRTRDTLRGLPHLPADDTAIGSSDKLFDPRIADLDHRRAEALLQKHSRRREVGIMEWGQASILIRNSRNVRRKTRVTHCTARVRCSATPGAGHAASSARSLGGLALDQIFERARRRHGRGQTAEPPGDKCSVVLAPEATVRLFSMLNRAAFTASAYHDGLSFLREHMGTQVFDRRIDLRDDATDASGMPFPFDLEGSAKRPIELIVKGTPQTPALDQRQAALLGLPPTGHAVAGNDAQAQNLFLEPGDSSDDDLLEAASGGVFIGWLEPVECFDQPRVRFRARACGIRRIGGGQLAESLPDLIWEDSLLRTLSSLLGVGSATVTWSLEGFLGAISAPALALGELTGLRPDPRV